MFWVLTPITSILYINLPRVVWVGITIVDEVSIEETSDVLPENSRLLLDGWGNPLFDSGTENIIIH